MRKRKHKKKFKASQYDKLIVDIKNNLTTRLDDLMSKLLNSAPDKLFDMADAASSNEEQNRYFELMNLVRSLKSELASTFTAEIRKFLVPASDYQSINPENNKEPDELSLIDPEEMEGMVLIKGIGGRATAQYREQLSHLEARLEHLSLKTSAVFDTEALSPINFCQAFDNTIKDHFDTDARKLLFGMYEAEISNKLESLYDSINNRLIDAGILPQIKLNITSQQHKRRQGDKSANGHVDADDQQQSTFQEGSCGSATGNSSNPAGGSTGAAAPGGHNGNDRLVGSSAGGYALTAPPGGTYHHPQTVGAAGTAHNQAINAGQGAQTTDAAAQIAGQPNNTTSGSAGVNASNQNTDYSAASEYDFQHYTAGIPAAQVGHALSSFLGTPINRETLAEGTATPGSPIYPASTSQHFGHDEIIQALSGLQTQPQFVQPQENRFDAEAIKQAVISELAKSTGGVVTKRINQIAEKTIDFIELIFDAIIDDEEISDTIKTLLLRLQIPIIKASMSDQEFFIYDDHAARVLLDKIAEVGVGVTDHTDEMYGHLDKIVSKILSEYDLTTETFQNALDDLNSIIEKQEEAARQKEEDAQQQTLRSHARNTVLKALRVVTTGKILPEAVHPLILKRWPTLMFNHYLQFGKENDEWVSLVETLRDIIESIQPINTPEDLAILLADKDDIIATAHEYLSGSIKSQKDIDTVLDGLKQTYERHIESASYTEEEVQQAEETIENIEEDEEDNIAEQLRSNEPVPDIPPNTTPGMWYQLYMGDDQITRRCKLSVIVPEDSNLMFVNHRGELVVEKSFDEFNNEIASNKTRLIMGHSAFDHALRTVVTRIDR